jgi:pimeloyl-ACP methyl ester carboxylesterase
MRKKRVREDMTGYSKMETAFVVCLFILFGAVLLASTVQRDFGRVAVSNVTYENANGIRIRAKLLRPAELDEGETLPGVVYIHGYQNNRETSDAYSIEMARRGFVVLSIDAIGRGNSGIPNDPVNPDFDETYGARSSLAYLKELPYVDPERVGMMGHSLGAEMAYQVALEDPSVEALVISGFAYTTEATSQRPKNMLMIFGKWDEYRGRMTGTDDFEAEWMETPQTEQVIPVEDPQFGVTYGDFEGGTARRVSMPRAIHIQESHSRAAVAEAVEWMRAALNPPSSYWIRATDQVWHYKEWATLVAMLAGFASLLPLGAELLRLDLFAPVRQPLPEGHVRSVGEALALAAVNGLLMWLYLPLILILFAVHIYVVPIDSVFPMMMVNGMVWWFFASNLIGYGIFRLWFRRKSQSEGLMSYDLGVSHQEDGYGIDWGRMGRTALLAGVLFAFIYVSEHLLEWIFLVDFRFIFPFASDLTPYRALMLLLYFPFLLVGFLQNGLFLHGQLRWPRLGKRWQTFLLWAGLNTLVMVVPLILFLAVQYVPLLTTGAIPLTGPSGVFVPFVMNLFHIIGVLIVVVPISTWFFQRSGTIYLGAFLNAALVAWMFASSQVIAPIPV